MQVTRYRWHSALLTKRHVSYRRWRLRVWLCLNSYFRTYSQSGKDGKILLPCHLSHRQGDLDVSLLKSIFILSLYGQDSSTDQAARGAPRHSRKVILLSRFFQLQTLSSSQKSTKTKSFPWSSAVLQSEVELTACRQTGALSWPEMSI